MLERKFKCDRCKRNFEGNAWKIGWGEYCYGCHIKEREKLNKIEDNK